MPQVPGFESLEQWGEFDHRGIHLLLVIDKTIGSVIRDGIIIFADIG